MRARAAVAWRIGSVVSLVASLRIFDDVQGVVPAEGLHQW
jgi:hypothetical protein